MCASRMQASRMYVAHAAEFASWVADCICHTATKSEAASLIHDGSSWIYLDDIDAICLIKTWVSVSACSPGSAGSAERRARICAARRR